MRFTCKFLIPLLACGHATAQVQSIGGTTVPTRSPSIVLDGLTRASKLKDQGEKRRQTLQVFRELGMDDTAFYRARLIYEDLDGDGEYEALLLVDHDLANLSLIIFKQKGKQWYKLASPADFSCWCKYEWPLLDAFVEVKEWAFDSNAGPRRLLIVRGSSGGTGLYDRALNVFVLQGFELRHVLGVTEERRDCSSPDGNCDLTHTELIPVANAERPFIAAIEFHRHLPAATTETFNDQTWWYGRQATSCSTFTWQKSTRRFGKDKQSTNDFCKSIPSVPIKVN